MEEQKFHSLVKALHEHEGMEEVFLLSKDGSIIYKSGEFPLTDDEAKSILSAWMEKEPSLSFQNFRFAILKNDELQLAAKNIGKGKGKGNIIGSITRGGDYLIAHTRDEALILLEWSIFINKIAWS